MMNLYNLLDEINLMRGQSWIRQHEVPMQHTPVLWPDPISHLAQARPDHPVMYFAPEKLAATAARFAAGFRGQVTYAVKANDRLDVLHTLVQAGIDAFDVASPAEIASVRRASATAVLHYNNPVRSDAEVAAGQRAGVASWSVDDAQELARLAHLGARGEVAVRFALPIKGAAYDFGQKFGATPEAAVILLQRAVQLGFAPALCFHPGTQCAAPQVWADYIAAAAQIATRAGVRIRRLNVGGGFPAHLTGAAPDLERHFATIHTAVQQVFGADAPDLLCEPGRAMAAECASVAVRIKALRADGRVFLNDGIYGGLADLRDMGAPDRRRVVSVDGALRTGPMTPRVLFGPTCDSLDRIPGCVDLPVQTQPGDYLIFDAMGAYSIVMATGFNGYGLQEVVTVRQTGA